MDLFLLIFLQFFYIWSLKIVISYVFQENLVLEVSKLKKIRNLNLARKLLKKHELKVLFQFFVPTDLKFKKQALGYQKFFWTIDINTSLFYPGSIREIYVFQCSCLLSRYFSAFYSSCNICGKVRNFFMKFCHFSLARILTNKKFSPMKSFSATETLTFILIFTGTLIFADSIWEWHSSS